LELTHANAFNTFLLNYCVIGQHLLIFAAELVSSNIGDKFFWGE